MKQIFEGLTIAIPESRQLDVLANLFSKRGANTLRCPLVAIHDSPNEKSIKAWLQAFIAKPPDIFIILTGEGIKRLTAFAERFELKDSWQAALKQSYLLARGPKPNRALKLLDLQADELAVAPTTDGIIESLKQLSLKEKQIAVQLYGEDPNTKLQTFLTSQSLNYNTIAPYIYASDSESQAVIQLIDSLANGEIDVICFTSKAQYQRLAKVAKKVSKTESLSRGLSATRIAAVGPVVAEQLNEAGFRVDVTPDSQFFMKPMVRAVERLIIDQS